MKKKATPSKAATGSCCPGHPPVKPPVKTPTWESLRKRIGLATDTIYEVPDDEEKKSPIPKDLKVLHDFNCPNGILLEVASLSFKGDSLIRIMARPGKSSCCQISFHMQLGEALSRLLPGFWHSRKFLQRHDPLVRCQDSPDTEGTIPHAVCLTYDISLRNHI